MPYFEMHTFFPLFFRKHSDEPWKMWQTCRIQFSIACFEYLSSHHLKSPHRQVLPSSCICFKKPLCQFSTAALWPRKAKCWKYCPPQLDRSSSAICTPRVLQEGTRVCCPSAPAASDWWAPRTERVETAGSCFQGSAFAISYTETTPGEALQSMGKMTA